MIIASDALIRRHAAHGEVTGLVQGIRLRLARRKAYRDTINALSALSDRELADLGITRSQIADTARACVYETRRTA